MKQGEQRTGGTLTWLGDFREGAGLANMPTVVCQQLLARATAPAAMMKAETNQPSPQSHFEKTSQLF